MIVLQLKSSHTPNDLTDIATIIHYIFRHTGYQIVGHEVQQIGKIFDNTSAAQRSKSIIKFCSDNKIKYLSYHSPIFQRGENIWNEKWNQRIKNSIMETAREADFVAKACSLDEKVTVISHLTNFVPLDILPITRADKFKMIDKTEKEFLALMDQLSEKYSNTCQFAVENSYPKYEDGFATTGPFHPAEVTRLEQYGIKTVLDLSHYKLYSNYIQYGKGNQCGDLDREIYGKTPSWQECIQIVSNSLAVLHISDARGYTEPGEGLPVGAGEISVFSDILKDVNAMTAGHVQGTIELAEGHLHSGRLQMESAISLLEELPAGILADPN